LLEGSTPLARTVGIHARIANENRPDYSQVTLVSLGRALFYGECVLMLRQGASPVCIWSAGILRPSNRVLALRQKATDLVRRKVLPDECDEKKNRKPASQSCETGFMNLE
jgi:hypothetical protein